MFEASLVNRPNSRIAKATLSQPLILPQKVEVVPDHRGLRHSLFVPKALGSVPAATQMSRKGVLSRRSINNSILVL